MSETTKQCGNKKREKFVRLAERCEVKAYVAPARMVAIARERTEGFVHYFVLSGADSKNLERLVESAYMQGLHDMLDVISGKFGKIEELANEEMRQQS